MSDLRDQAAYARTYGAIDDPKPSENGKFARVGSALAKPDEDDKANKFVPVWKQTVTDEKGRRRLHGAFTGGFSAGYGNTVGSKEGFVPTSFQSSRSQRAAVLQQRAEDLMDDEDRGEYANTLTTTAAFAELSGGLEQTAARIVAPESLLMAPVDPIGMRLLSKMGWKPGQGIGPRVKRNPKKRRLGQEQANAEPANGAKRVYGLQISLDDLKKNKDTEEDEDDRYDESDPRFDPYAQGHTFAPKDVSISLDLKGKQNSHGLGFDPFKHTPDFKTDLGRFGKKLEDETYRLGMSGIGGTSSSAGKLASDFGYGVFEEAEEEVEVYGSEDLTNYDIAISTNKNDKQQQQQRAAAAAAAAATAAARPQPTLRPRTQLDQRTADGSLVLPNFCLSAEPMLQQELTYRPPKVPDDFVPFHEFPKDATVPLRVRSNNMNAQRRAELLGEQQLPSSQSVFELLSEADRKKIALATGKADVTPAVAASPMAMYSHDPLKQTRFKLFLQGFPFEYPSGWTQAQKDSEMIEFRTTAAAFNRIPDAMSSRFTHATVTAKSLSAPGLFNPLELGAAAAAAAKTEMQLKQEAEEKARLELEKQQGAEGKIIHEVQDWVPEKLLCRRFNCPDPYQNRPKPGTILTPKDQANQFLTSLAAPMGLPMQFGSSRSFVPAVAPTYEDAKPIKLEPTPSGTSTSTSTSTSTTNTTIAGNTTTNYESNEQAAQGEENDEDLEAEERPELSIFKAIFESDDDEDDDDDE